MNTSQPHLPYLPKEIVDIILKTSMYHYMNFTEMTQSRLISKEMNKYASELIELHTDIIEAIDEPNFLDKLILAYGNKSMLELNKGKYTNVRYRMFELVNEEISQTFYATDFFVKDIIHKFYYCKVKTKKRLTSFQYNKRKMQKALSAIYRLGSVQELRRYFKLLALKLLFESDPIDIADGLSLNDEYFNSYQDYKDFLEDCEIEHSDSEFQSYKENLNYYMVDGYDILFNVNHLFHTARTQLRYKNESNTFGKTLKTLECLNANACAKSLNCILQMIEYLPIFDISLMTVKFND